MSRYSQQFLNLGKSVVDSTIALDRQVLSGQVKLWELKFEALKRLCLFHHLPYTNTKIAKKALKQRYDALKNRSVAPATATTAAVAPATAAVAPATAAVAPATAAAVAPATAAVAPATAAVAPATAAAVAPATAAAVAPATAKDHGGWVEKIYDVDSHLAYKESEGELTYLLPSGLLIYVPDPRFSRGVAIARYNKTKQTFIPLIVGEHLKTWGFLMKPWVNDELYSRTKREAKNRKEEEKLARRAASLALLNRI